MTRVSLNSDIGEGFGAWSFGDDDALFEVISAANIACGFHAGDPSIMRATCEAAVARGVSIGAHVAYRDLAGFGRRFVDVTTAALANDLLYQFGALQAMAHTAGGRVQYIKAHGALYNTSAHHVGHATSIIDAALLFDAALPILCQPGTATWNLALERGLTPLAEVFADRAYQSDGLLVARSVAGSVVTNPSEAAARAVRMVTAGEVVALTGDVVQLGEVASVCVHSDTPGAATIARAVREALEGSGVEIVGIG